MKGGLVDASLTFVGAGRGKGRRGSNSLMDRLAGQVLWASNRVRGANLGEPPTLDHELVAF